MEESGDLFVDPDEDEIFFYNVTESQKETMMRVAGNESVELEMKALISDAQTGTNDCSNCEYEKIASSQKEFVYTEEGSASRMSPSSNPSIAHIETINGENTTGKSLQMNNLIDLSEQDIYKKSHAYEEVCISPDYYMKDLIDLNEQDIFKKSHAYEEVCISSDYYMTPDGRKKDKDTLNDHLECKFSSPGKPIIDKNILRTPKSIVKADKDGGFLKVLSEIALVKAEADENSFKDNPKSFDHTLKSESVNDDNKENKQSEPYSDNQIKIIEASPPKLHQNSAVKKLSYESNKQRISYCFLEKLNEENMDVSGTINNENLKTSEGIVQEKISENDSSPNNEGVHNLREHEDMFSNEKSDESDELEIVFQKLTDANTGKPCEASNSQTQYSNKNLELFEISDEDEMFVDEADKQASGTNPLDVLRNPSPEPPSGADDALGENPQQNDPETATEFNGLKEQTKKLLEELCEETKRDTSPGTCGLRLSADAKKVVDILRVVGLGDSMCSPDQYFDLDKINNSFSTTEISDVLNDTFSKSLKQMTNKDLETLLEKLATCTIDANKAARDQSAAEKEVLTKMKNPPNFNIGSGGNAKSEQQIKSNSKVKVISLNKVGETRRKERPKTPHKTTPMLYKSSKNIAGNGFYHSENKELRVPGRGPNAQRGCQSAERNFRVENSERTPKPATATGTSRIPANSRIARRLNMKPSGTPLNKSQRNPKFQNIESPVHAYINSKIPVLISNVKAKSEPAFDMWMKQVGSGVKAQAVSSAIKNKDSRNQVKSNLPFVQYKSAIPLKLEAVGETRLPRLPPKMKKLLDCQSPEVSKHEGRIQLLAKKADSARTNDETSVDAKEFSVLVSKSAIKGAVLQ